MTKYAPLALLAALSLGLSGCNSLPSWMGGKKEEKAKLAGERITVLPASSELESDTTLKTTPFILPAPANSDSWPSHNGGFAAAYGNLAAAGHFDHITSTRAGDGDAFLHTLVIRPVIAEGLVFSMDGSGTITASDASDITKTRWTSAGVSEEDKPYIIGGGLAYDQGMLYAVSGRGVVVALKAATGQELWRKSTRAPFRSAPEVAAGKLVAVTVDNQAFAFNTSSGELVWNHRGINETTGIMNTVSPRAHGELVVIPYSSGEIYVVSLADGKEIWSNALTPGKRSQAGALFAGIGGDPVIDNDIVFTVSSGGLTSVQSLENGQRAWEKPIGSLNAPWLAGDYFFMLTTDNTLVAFVKFDGRIRWATKLKTFDDEENKKLPIIWKGPVLVAGNLAVVGSNGTLLFVSAETGKIVSSQSIPEDIYTPPVIAGGKMYLVSKDATLYALQ